MSIRDKHVDFGLGFHFGGLNYDQTWGFRLILLFWSLCVTYAYDYAQPDGPKRLSWSFGRTV